MDLLDGFFGRRLSRFLSKPGASSAWINTHHPEALADTLRPGDVLLVEGTSRISTAIKFLTQSTWSHAAIYVGDALGEPTSGDERRVLIEADLIDGVRAVPLSLYARSHTRICRPVGLRPDDLRRVIEYVTARIGQQYDLGNLLDLARFLFPFPPVPARWRRRLISLGAGQPTRAICSTLVAGAFQSVRYPVLPYVTLIDSTDPCKKQHCREILHIHDSQLFAPRDFDISPYFRIIKPTIEFGFDYHALQWADDIAVPAIPRAGRSSKRKAPARSVSPVTHAAPVPGALRNG